MTTMVGLHRIDALSFRASSTFTSGWPLQIKTVTTDGGHTEVTWYTDDEEVLRRLMDAINETMDAIRKERTDKAA